MLLIQFTDNFYRPNRKRLMNLYSQFNMKLKDYNKQP